VCGVKAGPHQLLAVNNQPVIANKKDKKTKKITAHVWYFPTNERPVEKLPCK
jgi:hypothetical protein